MKKDKNLIIKEAYLVYLENCPVHKWASKAVMIHENTSKKWRDEDKDFDDLCEAKISLWVGKTVKRAKPEFQLERLMREDFKPPTQGVNVEGEVNVIFHESLKQDEFRTISTT